MDWNAAQYDIAFDKDKDKGKKVEGQKDAPV